MPTGSRRDLLPSTYTVLTHPAIVALRGFLSHDVITGLIREAKERYQGDHLNRAVTLEAIATEVTRKATALDLQPPRLINATGIVIHTGLGTAPLSPIARAHVLVATGATRTGGEGMGGRTERVERGLRILTGGEAACVTVQNAATCTLVGSALAGGREIVCAARDLLEIGRGIRLQDLFETSSARVVPVGSANCVRLEDYERAITPRTALVLRIWHSNYASTGYVSHVDTPALARLAHAHGLPLVLNLGAGSLVDLREKGLPYSPTIQDGLRDGADLVLASGDKLIGGPQAGIAVGGAALVWQLAAQPLYRAVRPAKLDIAALEGTLACYLAGRAWEEIPVLRLLAATPSELQRRAQAITAALAPGPLTVEPVVDTARCGGAALPDTALPTWTLRVTSDTHHTETLYRLLQNEGVVGRRAQRAVVLDLRSVCPEDDPHLADALNLCCRAPAEGVHATYRAVAVT